MKIFNVQTWAVGQERWNGMANSADLHQTKRGSLILVCSLSRLACPSIKGPIWYIFVCYSFTSGVKIKDENNHKTDVPVEVDQVNQNFIEYIVLSGNLYNNVDEPVITYNFTIKAQKFGTRVPELTDSVDSVDQMNQNFSE